METDKRPTVRSGAESPVAVVFEESEQRSAAYKGGEQIGECEYSASGGVWTITHTGVRPAFEGQGIARRLLDCVVDAARARGCRIVPLCSYAQRVMTGRDAYRDVL